MPAWLLPSHGSRAAAAGTGWPAGDKRITWWITQLLFAVSGTTTSAPQRQKKSWGSVWRCWLSSASRANTSSVVAQPLPLCVYACLCVHVLTLLVSSCTVPSLGMLYSLSGLFCRHREGLDSLSTVDCVHYKMTGFFFQLHQLMAQLLMHVKARVSVKWYDSTEIK